MREQNLTNQSKYLSYLLRHGADREGLARATAGWVKIADIEALSAAAGKPLRRAQIEQIVASDAKGRYSLGSGGQTIRANQGHSLPVELELQAATPPEFLYHGTASRFLGAIAAQGLRAMGRHHVHLSADEATARTVGARHGQPVVLKVRAAALHRQGVPFFRSTNGVWLVDSVPAEALAFPGQPD